jgi:tripartite-type tricarboxylate transporter receptor subunit TctC
MKLPRRQFLHAAAGAVAFSSRPRFAWAQAYPIRPVRIIVGFSPAGSTDITARLLGQWLSEHLGQPFIIENRPGAASNIGTEAVINAAPDGYTVLMVSAPNAINATLYEKLRFNFIRDVKPVVGIIRIPLVMQVNPTVPVKTVPEFIDYAKANSGRVNFASSGVGAANHMAGELFKAMTGINMAHVPYRSSGPALTDLLGGQVQVMFDAITSSIGYIKPGKLRALAVTSTMRSELLPDTPTIGEFVSGYEASNWFGLGVPKNTPVEIVGKLNRAVNEALGDPKMKARLADIGGTVLPGSPADFEKLIAGETEKWAKVVKFAGIKLE